jgi:DNA-binding response OmpR family regulator
MSRANPLILVADDETHILHVVSMKLRNAGYEVITAEDGEEGFEAAVEKQPDLIITDYQMPYMSGLEMCMKLKADDRTRATPALMLTARGAGLGREFLNQTNIVGMLSKPFSPREVLARVEDILGGKHAPEVGKDS